MDQNIHHGYLESYLVKETKLKKKKKYYVNGQSKNCTEVEDFSEDYCNRGGRPERNLNEQC